MDTAAKNSTLRRFLQLKERRDTLLSRRSMLSDQESEQKAEELQKRLRKRLGPGPKIGADWEFMYVVDDETKASVFTEEEFKAWLAPSKEIAAIEQEIDLIEGEIKELVDQDATAHHPTILGKSYSLPAASPSRRARDRAYAYDLLLSLWGLNGPPRSMSIREIVEDANERRPLDDKKRNPAGISDSTVRRVLLDSLGE